MPPGGKAGADHELHLVENHEGKQQVIVGITEDSEHHRGAHGKTFFRAAEKDGDRVCLTKAEESTGNPDETLNDCKQDERGGDEAEQVAEVELLPVVLDGGGGEGGIDHEPDGEAVVIVDERAVTRGPGAEPSLSELSENKGEENLIADGKYSVETDKSAVPAVRREEDSYEQGGDKDTDDAGDGGGADGGGYVAPGDGGECDAALHGGRETCHVEESGEKSGSHELLQQGAAEADHDREQRKR